MPDFDILERHIRESFNESEEWLLNDLQRIQRDHIASDNSSGNIPYRLIYMFGGANLSGKKDSDLSLLLQYLYDVKDVDNEQVAEEGRAQGRPRMTYIFCFDQSYKMKENIGKDVAGINQFFKERASVNHVVRAAGQTVKDPPSLKYQEDTRSPEELKTTTLLSSYMFGPHVKVFFFQRNLTSTCLANMDPRDRINYIQANGIYKMVSECEGQSGPVYSYLEHLVNQTFCDEGNPGEVYVYNCAWMDLRNMVGRYSANVYLEEYPELLRILAKDYGCGTENATIRKFLLNNHYRDVFSNEQIVLARDSAELREAEITGRSNFKAFTEIRQRTNNERKWNTAKEKNKIRAEGGGKRRTQRRSKKKTSKSRRWQK
jgi:hypothetical protein